MQELLSTMADITTQKIAQNCFATLQEYARDLCAVPSSDSLHSYPYACRVYAPSERRFAAVLACNTTSENSYDIDTSGVVVGVKHISNDYVHAGDTIMVLENSELAYKVEEKQGEIRETSQMYYQALDRSPENMLPIKIRLNVLNQGLNDLLERQKKLTLVAGMDSKVLTMDWNFARYDFV